MHLTPVEQRQFKKQFSVALHNLSQIEVYWSPSIRRILSRSPQAARRFKLPVDAVLVGAYAHPFNLSEFLDDVDDLLELLTRHPAPSEPT